MNKLDKICEALALAETQLKWYAYHAEDREEAHQAEQKCTEALSILQSLKSVEGLGEAINIYDIHGITDDNGQNDKMIVPLSEAAKNWNELVGGEHE